MWLLGVRMVRRIVHVPKLRVEALCAHECLGDGRVEFFSRRYHVPQRPQRILGARSVLIQQQGQEGGLHDDCVDRLPGNGLRDIPL